jgi:hypothetical protein
MSLNFLNTYIGRNGKLYYIHDRKVVLRNLDCDSFLFDIFEWNQFVTCVGGRFVSESDMNKRISELEITKRGYVHTDAELRGIRNAIVKSRQARKKAVKQARRAVAKQRTLDMRIEREQSPMPANFDAVIEEVNKLSVRQRKRETRAANKIVMKELLLKSKGEFVSEMKTAEGIDINWFADYLTNKNIRNFYVEFTPQEAEIALTQWGMTRNPGRNMWGVKFRHEHLLLEAHPDSWPAIKRHIAANLLAIGLPEQFWFPESMMHSATVSTSCLLKWNEEQSSKVLNHAPVFSPLWAVSAKYKQMYARIRVLLRTYLSEAHESALESIVDFFMISYIASFMPDTVLSQVSLGYMISRIQGEHGYDAMINGVHNAVIMKGIALFSRAFGGFFSYLQFSSKKRSGKKASKAQDKSGEYKSEGLSEDLSTIASMMKETIESPIMTAVRTSFLTMAALRMFPKTHAYKIYEYLGEAPRGDVLTLTAMLLESVASLIKVGEQLVAGSTISELLFAKNPVVAAMSELDVLLLQKDNLFSGVAVPGKMCQREFVKRGEAALSVIEPVVKKANPLSAGYGRVTKMYNTMLLEVQSVRGRITSGNRASPFFLIIEGEPGIGKSLMVPMTCNIWSKLKGRDNFSMSHIFPRSNSSDYWEGYEMFSHPFIHYSELGNSTKSILQAQGDPIVKELTSVVDALPMFANMAFEGKGKVSVIPEMVVADTNHPDFGLSWFVRNPAAYMRRPFYLTARVLPELRKEGTVGIDSDKGEGLRLMDKYAWTIYRYNQLSNTAAEKKFIVQDVGVDVMVDTMRNLMRKHMETQDKLLLLKNADVNTVYGQEYTGITAQVNFAADEKVGYPVGKLTSESYEVFVRDSANSMWNIMSWPYRHVLKQSEAIGYTGEFAKRLTRLVGSLLGESMLLAFAHIMKWLFLFNTTLFYWCSFFLISFLIAVLPWNWTLFLRLGFIFLPWVCLFEVFRRADISNMLIRGTTVEQRVNDLTQYLQSDDVTRHVETTNTTFKLLVGGTAMTVAVSLLAMMWRAYSTQEEEYVSEDQSLFTKPSVANSELNELEEKIEARYNLVHIENKIKPEWDNAMTIKTDFNYRGPALNLDNKLRANLREFIFVIEGERTSVNGAQLLGVKEDLVLLPKHCFRENSRMLISINGRPLVKDNTVQFENGVETFATRDRIIEVGSDLLLMRVSAMQFPDILSHFGDNKVTVGTAVFCGKNVKFNHVDKMVINPKTDRQIDLPVGLVYESIHHVGLCGQPLVAEMVGGSRIVGIHIAGFVPNGSDNHAPLEGMCVASPITSRAILLGIEKLRNSTIMMPVMSESDIIMDLHEPKRKSLLFYENNPVLEYRGSTGAPVFIGKSKITPSVIKEDVPTLFEETLGVKLNKNFAAPKMGPFKGPTGEWISPFNNGFRKFAKARYALRWDVLELCIRDSVEQAVRELKNMGINELRPLTILEAVNGSPNNPNIRRIDPSTGAGYGYRGKKSDWLELMSDSPLEVDREPISTLKEDMLSTCKLWSLGKTNGSIKCVKLKDEPREAEKVKLGKTRLFYPDDVRILTLSRQYLAPLLTLMMINDNIFDSCLGIDMHREGDAFYREFLKFCDEHKADPEACVLEGDYGGFDVSMPYDIGLAANTVIYRVLEKMGYNQTALQMTRGVLSDGLNPIVEIQSDIFVVPGLMPSGTFGTVNINCIRNQIMLKYFFIMQGLTFEDYHVRFCKRTHGDDLTGVVSPLISHKVNNSTYADFVCKAYGMEFTTPEKVAVDKPLRSLSEMSFLKRNFEWRADLNMYTAVLDIESIGKMLQWTMPSEAVTMEEQLKQTMNSALWEVFMGHSREQFENFREKLRSIFKERTGVELSGLVSWLTIYNSICPEKIALRDMEVQGEFELYYGAQPAHSNQIADLLMQA